MFLSWLTIGVLVLEVFWAGRLWQRTVSPARTEDPVTAAPMVQDLLSGLQDWEEETWASLEDLAQLSRFAGV